MKRLLFVLFAGLVLAGCAIWEDPLAPKTAHSVNLKRYQGTGTNWRDCRCTSSATARNPKPITRSGRTATSVLNRCLTADWQWEEAKGKAYPQVPGKTDKLWVEFDTWFSR
jgi:apolipoprotein D and lipocalin family protein